MIGSNTPDISGSYSLSFQGKALRVVFFATQLYDLACGRPYGYGGAETELWNVAKAVADDTGFDARTLTLTNETRNPLHFGRLQLHLVPPSDAISYKDSWLTRRKTIIKYYLRLLKALKGQKADIYFSKLASSEASTVWLASRLVRGKFVYRVEHDWETNPEDLVNIIFRGSRFWANIFLYCLRRADLVVSQTEKQRSALKRNFDVESVLIPNGHVMPPDETLEHDPAKRTSVLWVARAHPMKRPQLFLDLAERHSHLSFVMVMAKSPEHDSLFQECQERANLLANVQFIPGLSPENLEEVYRLARLFVLTSEAEGFSNVIIEALKNGVPVISLGHNPNDMLQVVESDSAVNPAFGYFTNDSLDVTTNLVEKLSSDSEFWSISHYEARRFAVETFGLSHVFQLYREQFHRLMVTA